MFVSAGSCWGLGGSHTEPGLPGQLPGQPLSSGTPPRGPRRVRWLAQQPLTLDLVEVAGFLLRQEGGVGVLPGIHLVHKERAEPAAFIVLGIESAG